MQNFIFFGERVTWLNDTGDDVVSGQPVQIGNMSGVAGVNIADGASGTVALEGVYEFPRVALEAMPDPGTRMYGLPDGTVTVDNTAVGAFYLGVSHSTDTRDADTNVQILLQNEGSAPVVADTVAAIVPSDYTPIAGVYGDLAAARTSVAAFAAEVETRDDAQTTKINAILTALKDAGLMAS